MTITLPSPVDGSIHIRLTKIPSLNKFYSASHWIVRKKLKDSYAEDILQQLSQYDKVAFNTMEVIFFCNVRLDLDNCIMGVKFALDSFRTWGGIPDDGPKYVKRILMEHNDLMPKGMCEIILRRLS
jgi:hypothetical protein